MTAIWKISPCVLGIVVWISSLGSAVALEPAEIVFAVRQPGAGGHWYENFGYYAFDQNHKAYGAEGRLCRLNLRTGSLAVLVDDPAGAVRDPQVHYDGRKILFSYRRGGSDWFHLYEVNIDGSGLRQLTSGPFDDIEPTYLPDGSIVFCSSRCRRWVPCWYTPVAILYACDADGGNVHPISANVEHDNTPWPMSDGRVLYERWEYVDRSRVSFHHLWTANPDGTDQMVFYGNMHPGTLMIDAKPIPDGTGRVVAVFSPKHGRKEHAGAIAIVTPKTGPDDLGSAQQITEAVDFRDPYPLDAAWRQAITGWEARLPSARAGAGEAGVRKMGTGSARFCILTDMYAPHLAVPVPIFHAFSSGQGEAATQFDPSEMAFLVARGPNVLLMDRRGRTRPVYRLPDAWIAAGAECHEPRPLAARPREPIIPPRAARGQATGRLVLEDIYQGRRMDGVRRGEIKRLLILETLPKPINYSGKMPPISYGGTYLLERVLGTVPVEPDGSAYLEVPALRPLVLVALDEKNNSIKRMHSFLTVQPGETTGCVGCHEQRIRTPRNPGRSIVQALDRPPSAIAPLPDIPDVFDFPRDIQPILDRHCIGCHDYDRRAGRVILTGDRGPIFSHSYYTLTALGYVSDGRDRIRTNLPPRAVGTSASPLMTMLDGSHYGARLSAHEQDMIRYWIESAAAYPGTYAALGTGMIGGFPRSKLDTRDRQWPSSVAAAEAIQRRCAGCHDRSMPLPRYLSDNLGLVLSNPDFRDVRVRYSRHLFFNLSRPEKSLILLAPLAPAAGGLGLCRSRATGDRAEVFGDTADPDYQRILRLCRDGEHYLATNQRFDMPGFRPAPTYVREMQRYGTLPADLPPDAQIDVYATDRAYWRLHHVPWTALRPVIERPMCRLPTAR